MPEVIPIRATRPPDCAKALALMEEARDLLVGLVDSGQVEHGSPPEAAVWDLDSAIGMLTPDEDDKGS